MVHQIKLKKGGLKQMSEEKKGDVTIYIRLKPIHRKNLEYFRRQFGVGYGTAIKMIVETLKDVRLQYCGKCDQTFLQNKDCHCCPRCGDSLVTTKKGKEK
jgi:hypothetical protein